MLSPGPGSPSEFNCEKTIAESRTRHLPIFGVCLGLQALVEAYGGQLKQMDVPTHGKSSKIRLLPGPEHKEPNNDDGKQISEFYYFLIFKLYFN